MMNCPVCDQPSGGIICESCGFDRSMDYENFPTLVPLPQNSASVSGRSRQRRTHAASLFSCPNCGGRQFSISIPHGACICAGCGEMIHLRNPLAASDAWKAQMTKLVRLLHARHAAVSHQDSGQPREQQARQSALSALLSVLQSNSKK